MPEKQTRVRELIQATSHEMRLRVVAGVDGLDRAISEKELHRPGLLLAGFSDEFPEDRVQLIGDTETMYLESLPKEKLLEALTRLLSYNIPCVIVTGRNKVLPTMKKMAERRKIPVITSTKPSSDLAFLLTNYLSHAFAPTEQIHGSLVDCYGTGLLFVGRAGIGKSEIALDLVERGHRLVADDIVNLSLIPPDIVSGHGPEMLKHFIEIRGVGIINIRELFGVRAIRLQKRVETVVELVDWNDKEDYERLGINDTYREFFGVKIPLIKLPIYPGKNITVIAEAIALNLHLKIYGYHAAKDLHKRLLKNLKAKRKINTYLRWDTE